MVAAQVTVVPANLKAVAVAPTVCGSLRTAPGIPGYLVDGPEDLKRE